MVSFHSIVFMRSSVSKLASQKRGVYLINSVENFLKFRHYFASEGLVILNFSKEKDIFV